jgi:hypothetical protein
MLIILPQAIISFVSEDLFASYTKQIQLEFLNNLVGFFKPNLIRAQKLEHNAWSYGEYHEYYQPAHCLADDKDATSCYNLTFEIHIKRKHGGYLLGRSSDRYMANNPPSYKKSVRLVDATVADSVQISSLDTSFNKHL